MLKYRGTNLARFGVIGVVVIVLVITIGLSPERLRSLAADVRHQALFDDAGGLAVGNEVSMSGVKVGSVTDIAVRDGLALVSFTVDGTTHLGSQSTAHIRTGTVLGERVLALQSAGAGSLRQTDVIPVSRTSSPYSLTEAVSDLTNNTAGTDTASINNSLNTLSDVIDRVAPQLSATFDGVTRISEAVNQRDSSLAALLNSAGDVTGILSDRSQQLNTLILNANDLLEVLVARRQAIVTLLVSTSTLSQQLSGLVHDNEQDLAPALQRLNSVTAMLERNRDLIGKALPGLAKYELMQGETVNAGPYYNAFVANLIPGQVLQPFLDYAFGFRRGTDAGQPPDNAGPRAEFPIPFNAIPGGSR